MDCNTCHSIQLHLMTRSFVGSTSRYVSITSKLQPRRHHGRRSGIAPDRSSDRRHSHQSIDPGIQGAYIQNTMHTSFGSSLHLQAGKQAKRTESTRKRTLSYAKMNRRSAAADDRADPRPSDLAPDPDVQKTWQLHHSTHTHPVPHTAYNNIQCQLTLF